MRAEEVNVRATMRRRSDRTLMRSGEYKWLEGTP